MIQKKSWKKYKTINSKFNAYFLPHKNVIHKRYVFYKRNQKSNESVDEFITAMHTVSKTCEFGAMGDEMIQDCIVVDIADAELSKKLELTSRLILQEAVKMIQTYKDVLQQQE